MKLYEILDGKRKEKMFSCIYVWTNLVNNKHYVGQAKYFYERMRVYKNRGATPKLQAAINKYGIDNFSIDILEKCDECMLDEREQYWMDYYQSYESEYGYNISKFASTTRGCYHDEETRRKISEAVRRNPVHLSGELNGMYGKSHDTEALKKISEASKKLWENEDYKKMQSDRMSGENNYFYGKHFFGEDNPRFGAHWDDEMKQHFRMVNSQTIMCVETQQIFHGCAEASEVIGGNKKNISQVLDKPNRTDKGFHFIRVNQE